MTQDPATNRPEADDLAYIKYSAKELLLHMAQKIDSSIADQSAFKLATTSTLSDIKASIMLSQAETKLAMTNFVTRQEMTNTRRWAIGAVIASAGTGVALLRLLEI